MSYRVVDERFWTDAKVRSLGHKNKLLFLYLMTCPHSHYCGVFYLPAPLVVYETGMSENDIRMGIESLSNGNQVKYDAENCLFWVVNMAKFNCSTEKHWAGAVAHIRTLHKSALIAEFAQKYLADKPYPLDTLPIPMGIPSDTHSIPTRYMEQEQEQEQEQKQELEQEKSAETSSVSTSPKSSTSACPKKPNTMVDDAFIAEMAANPAYEGIDVKREYGKMLAWLQTPRGRGKQPSRSRFVNWLNRAEPTMPQAGQPRTENVFDVLKGL